MGEDARVYATPRLISDIEFTCRDLIVQHADPGEDSVGMEVAVKHLAPTLAGSTVEIAVRITAVDGRKVTFDVSAKDELDTVSAGTHTRFVVEVARTKERLKAKAAKLAALGKVTPRRVNFPSRVVIRRHPTLYRAPWLKND